MKKFEHKTIILYFLITIYIIFISLIGYRNYSHIINYIIPIFWLFLTIISFHINKENINRIKFQTTKLQTIFITITIYLIIYFLLGLILGYNKSIYNHSLLGYIKNIWIYITPIIFMEYTRNTLVNSNSGIINKIIIIILFTICNLNIFHLFYNTTYIELFKNATSTILPTIATNILLTYITETCGYYGVLFYSIPQSIVTISLAIIPDLNWYYTGILGILVPLFVYISIKNINDKIENRESKRRLKKQSIFKLYYSIIPIIILAAFTAGIFKYKPTAILSNSMKPKFSRGDVVIIEKVNEKNINNLKKYDIIEYIFEDSVVVHRIINIENHADGTKLYTTMGDNNNTPDRKKVDQTQIKGKVKLMIPKIGYPSVLLSELLNKNKNVKIEKGKK